MEGIQSERDFFKSVPSLKVIEPTSQLSNGRKAAPLQLPKRRLTTASASQTIEVHKDQSTSVELELAEQEPDDNQSIGMLASLPVFLFSLVVHLGILILLAVWSFGNRAQQRDFVFEISDSQTDFETITFEVELDEVELDEPLDVLVPEVTDQWEADPHALAATEMLLETALDPMAEFDMTELKGGDRAKAETPIAKPSRARKDADFFGAKSVGDRFIFVIDCSSSMNGRRWHRASKELMSAINELDRYQSFLVLLYNTGTTVMMEKRYRDAELIQASGGNKHDFLRWLKDQRPAGGTYPSHAMYLALSHNPDAIYFLSDGELQDQTVRMLNSWNVHKRRFDGSIGKTPIHTISLGDGQGQETMETIAAQNDGSFHRF